VIIFFFARRRHEHQEFPTSALSKIWRVGTREKVKEFQPEDVEPDFEVVN
jgi:hypothetical protein